MRFYIAIYLYDVFEKRTEQQKNPSENGGYACSTQNTTISRISKLMIVNISF